MAKKTLSKKIRGVPAHYGVAKGKAVHIKSAEDIFKVSKGDLVITDKITSEYTEAFLRSAGVVSLRGGITCHAAIVCREANKPCLVSCDMAFEIFEEGKEFEIDTKTLLVTRLDEKD